MMRPTADRDGKNWKEDLKKGTKFIYCWNKAHGISSYEQILQDQTEGIDLGEAKWTKEDPGFSIDLMSRNEGIKFKFQINSFK